MKEKYQNDLLGWSKEEIKKEWDNCWEKLVMLDTQRNYGEYEELNKRLDKCVEAYYAVDCGTYWKVNSASRVRGNYMTYKVGK